MTVLDLTPAENLAGAWRQENQRFSQRLMIQTLFLRDTSRNMMSTVQYLDWQDVHICYITKLDCMACWTTCYLLNSLFQRDTDL